MNEQNTELFNQPNTDIDFFNQTAIEVTVTYPFLKQTEPMRFFFRVQMAKEEKEARQVFFGLTEDEQEAKRTEYNAKLLASLSTKLPENVPTLEEFYRQRESETEISFNTLVKDVIEKFFNSDNPMKQKIAADALNLYFSNSQPLEFFR
jgi:hypothetical protein